MYHTWGKQEINSSFVSKYLGDLDAGGGYY
jgi:hypothetical protein